MRTARLHFAEEERLAALRSYAILDTAPDPLFDKLTALAAHVCCTPIAAVALVDSERQWFKSTVGLGALQQIPRAWSFTSDAVSAGAPLIVTDARVHPRYANNPQVVGEPGIRAYAGVPLIGRDGLPLGALCVIDKTPRTFDARTLEILTVLADQVVLLLEARHPVEPEAARDVARVRAQGWRRPRRHRGSDDSAGSRLQTIASVCLAAALLGLSGVATWSGFATSAAASASRRSVFLHDAYTTARYWVEAEEPPPTQYVLQPSPGVVSDFNAAHTAVDAALASVIARGTPSEQAAAEDIRRRDDARADATSRLFLAVDRHDLAAAEKLENTVIEPDYHAVLDLVTEQAELHRQLDVTTGARLLRVEAIARWATGFAIGVGLLLIATFVWLRRLSSREQKRQATRNTHQATHDALTGLPNRLQFTRMLDQTTTAAKHTGGSVGVILLDLDRFREVNNALGHHTGDQLLQQIGPRLGEVLTSGDVLARLGDDRFAVMIASASAGDLALRELRAAASRLQSALALPFIVDDVALAVEATAGLATYPESGDTGQLLLQHADIAMNQAKSHHDAVAVYDPALDGHILGKLRLLADLRQATARDELVLHYQPLMEIATSRITGVEALARWQHPTEGLVQPAVFLPLAESTGFIHELTRWVLTRAAKDAKAWADAGEPLVVSVNLSARCLIDTNLPQQVKLILASVGLPSNLLKLEITESAIIADPVRAEDVINRLHDLGVGLSIDDFGTGYTSLAYLRDLPVQEIKIDQSFVAHMLVRQKDMVIVQAAVELAQRLGLDSVAEGIDDPALLCVLADMGCTTGQGYYLCRPLLSSALVPWLTSWKLSHSPTDSPAIAFPT
jgi:diguanylate cyclase (GGDEF)-like protein